MKHVNTKTFIRIDVLTSRVPRVVARLERQASEGCRDVDAAVDYIYSIPQKFNGHIHHNGQSNTYKQKITPKQLHRQ